MAFLVWLFLPAKLLVMSALSPRNRGAGIFCLTGSNEKMLGVTAVFFRLSSSSRYGAGRRPVLAQDAHAKCANLVNEPKRPAASYGIGKTLRFLKVKREPVRSHAQPVLSILEQGAGPSAAPTC